MHLREVTETKLALGGEASITIVTDMNDEEVFKVFASLWNKVFRFERRFSRFIPLSELASFNRTAGLKTPITPEFRQVLIEAKKLGQKTNGLFNPFIAPALQRAGYIMSALKGHETDAQISYAERVFSKIETLEIGDTWAKIPYQTAIDLGGCGKGYLADTLSKIINKDKRIQGHWISLSGDIACKGLDCDNNNITVGIQSAKMPSKISDWIINCRVDGLGIATSGTFKRDNQLDGQNWHHIIDPSTQKPAISDVQLATVCFDTALEADINASCAVILGSDKAIDFLKQRGARAALLQCVDKEGSYFERQFGGMIKKTKVDKGVS